MAEVQVPRGLRVPFIRDCLMLLLTPSGRASHIPFVTGGLIIRVVTIWASVHLANATEDDPAGIFAFLALFSVWMWFCLCSRRLHDSGSSNVIMVPLLIAEVCILLSVLDTSWIARSDDPEGTAAMIWGADRVVNAIACLIGLYIAKSHSDSGDNAYGPPFGEAVNGGWKTSAGSNLQATHAAPGNSTIARLDPNNRRRGGAAPENAAGGLPARIQPKSTPRRKGFGQR